MCVYSAFVREAYDQYPWLKPATVPFMPGIGPYDDKKYPPFNPLSPPPVIDPKILKEILDIGKRLDRIDKKLGLKDCLEEEASKRAFEAKIEDLIKQANALKKSVQCDDDGCNKIQQKAADNASKLLGSATSGYAQVIGTSSAIPVGAQWGINTAGSATCGAQAGSSAGQSLGHGTAGSAKGL